MNSIVQTQTSHNNGIAPKPDPNIFSSFVDRILRLVANSKGRKAVKSWVQTIMIVLLMNASVAWQTKHVNSAPPESRPTETLSGNATIRGMFDNSEIVITTTDRLAGAIHSLTWKGMEFINSTDHGRQLQSASSFDVGLTQPFWAECFNPTEAGSRRDGAGATSSSRLLKIDVGPSELETESQMAFWLAPGEKSSGRPALNTTVLSDHLLQKRVRIGYKSLPNVIEYDVQFKLPESETHRYAQFEALTGYMPPGFNEFRTLDLRTQELRPISDGPGEQSLPLVFANESGSHAMGVFSPDQPSRGFENAGYGRFRFIKERVVKWNCVFRVRDRARVMPSEYSFKVFVAIGSLEQVRSALVSLSKLASSPGQP
jgi:hypothetical protein